MCAMKQQKTTDPPVSRHRLCTSVSVEPLWRGPSWVFRISGMRDFPYNEFMRLIRRLSTEIETQDIVERGHIPDAASTGRRLRCQPMRPCLRCLRDVAPGRVLWFTSV